ncbi:MAG: DNA polymerase IV [Spirochaetota bacterium]|nr:DNA polymerase IV [Spirochaetota bacterium]
MDYGSRKIIHVDLDAFFASVEQKDHPELKGRCVIVGGSPDSRGVVCAASYEARKYGVHSAMASSRAYRLCPEAVFIKPRMHRYKELSNSMREIFRRHTELVEPLSLDEAYLDVTKNHLNIPSATNIARDIKKSIFQELGLTASCGVGPNKLVAKIASDYQKPDGLHVVRPKDVISFMRRLDLAKIPGVGKKTREKLASRGLKLCEDIYSIPIASLLRDFGHFGETIYEYARGIDHRPVRSSRPSKSCGSEITLPEDTLDMNIIYDALESEIATVAKRLSEKKLYGRTVSLKIKYHDFKTITRSKTPGFTLSDGKIISDICQELLSKTLAGQKKIRLVGVTISNFADRKNVSGQLSFDYY